VTCMCVVRGLWQVLVNCGFDAEEARTALQRHNGDVTLAAHDLESSPSAAVVSDGYATSPQLFMAVPASCPPPRVSHRVLSVGRFVRDHFVRVGLSHSVGCLSVAFWVRLDEQPSTECCLLRQDAVEKFVHPLLPGTLVEGRYSGGASPWYPGRIMRVNPDATYSGTWAEI